MLRLRLVELKVTSKLTLGAGGTEHKFYLYFYSEIVEAP